MAKLVTRLDPIWHELEEEKSEIERDIKTASDYETVSRLKRRLVYTTKAMDLLRQVADMLSALDF